MNKERKKIQSRKFKKALKTPTQSDRLSYKRKLCSIC